MSLACLSSLLCRSWVDEYVSVCWRSTVIYPVSSLEAHVTRATRKVCVSAKVFKPACCFIFYCCFFNFYSKFYLIYLLYFLLKKPSNTCTLYLFSNCLFLKKGFYPLVFSILFLFYLLVVFLLYRLLKKHLSTCTALS